MLQQSRLRSRPSRGPESNEGTSEKSSEREKSWWWLDQLSNFRVPSLPSWEFDDVSSVASSNVSDTDSIDDDIDNVENDVKEQSDNVAPEISSHSSKVYLQIGRPSYLERNLKLAYQQLNIPVERYLHIVYTDRKHLGEECSIKHPILIIV